MDLTKISTAQKDQIVASLLQAVDVAGGSIKRTAEQGEGLGISQEEKDRIIANALQSERGLRRLAFAMTEPLRQRLDYKGIGRKFLEVDELPQGEVPVYDRDFPEEPAVKISARGVPPLVERWSERIEIPTFEMTTRSALKYQEIEIRRFNALDRAKDKAAFELQIGEDDEIFKIIDTASGLTNAVTSAATVTRNALAAAFAEIEKNRLVVNNILMHASTYKGIRTWGRDDLDPVNQKALLETGLFAHIWGADIYISDRCTSNRVYLMASPKVLGKMPIRKDVEIKPFDNVPLLQLEFIVYEIIGMAIFNSRSVARINVG